MVQLDTMSGGYLYDRKLVKSLRKRGDQVEIISLPWRKYAAHLTDNFHFRLPRGFDLIIEDELNHPSFAQSKWTRTFISCCEPRPQFAFT